MTAGGGEGFTSLPAELITVLLAIISLIPLPRARIDTGSRGPCGQSEPRPPAGGQSGSRELPELPELPVAGHSGVTPQDREVNCRERGLQRGKSCPDDDSTGA